MGCIFLNGSFSPLPDLIMLIPQLLQQPMTMTAISALVIGSFGTNPFPRPSAM
ncbi:hypothetical protein J27TS7_30350 [Paenibacillus dendritiformis]|nr:hypothetical protein J27TS7_30350 [Paenibacillus dendritiformis]